MIRAYPNLAHVPGEPWYVGQAHGMTLEAWLIKNMPGYERRDVPPITISIDGEAIHHTYWPTVWLTREMQVEIRPAPQGIEYIIGAVIGLAIAAAAYVFRPSMPTTSNNQNAESGTKLLEASASANQVKLNDVVPEIAGRVRRYPDYLVAPHRVFGSDRRTQVMRVILSIGRGEYDIQPEDLLIGDTPFQSMGSAITYTLYEPGADLSDDVARLNWYNAPEVGPAVGSSGIPLQSSSDSDPQWEGALNFDGPNITSAPADVPDGWGPGLVVNITMPQWVVVTDGGTYDVITGNIRWQGLAVGDALRIPQLDSDNLLRIASITPGATADEDEFTLDVFIADPTGTYWAPVNNLSGGGVTWTINPERDPSFIITEVITDGFTFAGRLDGSTIPGWVGFPTLTNKTNANVVVRSGSEQGLWTTPFAACPKGETTNNVEWDVFASEGLVELGETSGNMYQITRTVQIRYREVGATAWEATISHDIAGRSRDQLGWTFREVLPRQMRPEVQIRRETAASDSVYIQDKLEFYGLRAQLTTPRRYDGITVLAVNLEGSDQIASQTDNQINVICTRKLPTMLGPGSWTTNNQPTRDISAWVRHIALSAGYTDADIDQEELWRLHQIWTDRGDTFDFIEADDSTVKEVLARVLRVGFAELTISEGKIKPARDEPRTAFQNVYSAQNMTEELKYSVTMPREDDADGVDVEYVDSETWTSETVRCRLPEDAGEHPEQIKAEGIVDRNKAFQLGMRHRLTLKYRRKNYSFATEMDALNSEYMNYDAIISDTPGQGQSMMLIEPDGSNLYVSEELDWSAGGNHMVAWRKPDGSLAGPYPAIEGEDGYHVTIGGENPELPTMDPNLEPPHVFFGPEASWTHPVLITSIQPQGFESVSVEADGYDERVYAYDNATAPALPPPIY